MTGTFFGTMNIGGFVLTAPNFDGCEIAGNIFAGSSFEALYIAKIP